MSFGRTSDRITGSDELIYHIYCSSFYNFTDRAIFISSSSDSCKFYLFNSAFINNSVDGLYGGAVYFGLKGSSEVKCVYATKSQTVGTDNGAVVFYMCVSNSITKSNYFTFLTCIDNGNPNEGNNMIKLINGHMVFTESNMTHSQIFRDSCFETTNGGNMTANFNTFANNTCQSHHIAFNGQSIYFLNNNIINLTLVKGRSGMIYFGDSVKAKFEGCAFVDTEYPYFVAAGQIVDLTLVNCSLIANTDMTRGSFSMDTSQLGNNEFLNQIIVKTIFCEYSFKDEVILQHNRFVDGVCMIAIYCDF